MVANLRGKKAEQGAKRTWPLRLQQMPAKNLAKAAFENAPELIRKQRLVAAWRRRRPGCEFRSGGALNDAADMTKSGGRGRHAGDKIGAMNEAIGDLAEGLIVASLKSEAADSGHAEAIHRTRQRRRRRNFLRRQRGKCGAEAVAGDEKWQSCCTTDPGRFRDLAIGGGGRVHEAAVHVEAFPGQRR